MSKRIDLNNIVILRTDRIGEVLLSTVAVSALRKRYMSAEVSFVTSRYSRPIVEGCEGIQKVITFDPKKEDGVFKRAVELAHVLRK